MQHPELFDPSTQPSPLLGEPNNIGPRHQEHRSSVIHEVSLVTAGLNPDDYIEYGQLIAVVVGAARQPLKDDRLQWEVVRLPWDRLLEQIDPTALRRGDIVHLTELGEYRNDGKYIFNGTAIEELSGEPTLDDYGYIPPTYFVGDEFLSNHWLDTITHNSIVWVDLNKYGDQLRANYDADQRTTHFDGDLGRFTVRFVAHVDYAEDLDLSGPEFLALLDRNEEILFFASSIDTTYTEGEFNDPYTVFYRYDSFK